MCTVGNLIIETHFILSNVESVLLPGLILSPFLQTPLIDKEREGRDRCMQTRPFPSTGKREKSETLFSIIYIHM